MGRRASQFGKDGSIQLLRGDGMLHIGLRGRSFSGVLALAAVALLESQAWAQGGTGLRGEYYDNPDFTSYKGGRLDTTVNFSDFTSAELEAMGLTPAGTADETFSVRWQGTLLATVTGSYTFIIRSDDGMRLWV